MENSNSSGHQLRNFVEKHKLRDRFSTIRFLAVVSITTAKNEITNRQMEVMISFENFNSTGQLMLMDSSIDPHLYPTVFEAKWQQMEHVDGQYLLISDIHSKNAMIGEYSVKVIPLKKLRD